MADKTLVCVDCGNEFVFTEANRTFIGKKVSKTNETMPECRKQKKHKETDIDFRKASARVIRAVFY
jgi:hypothetical protein